MMFATVSGCAQAVVHVQRSRADRLDAGYGRGEAAQSGTASNATPKTQTRSE
jgi:hypothetical protein